VGRRRPGGGGSVIEAVVLDIGSVLGVIIAALEQIIAETG
jgi:hypothetical protein